MPDGYELSDCRFVQYRAVVSAADAHYAGLDPVPTGKIWNVLSASISSSANDTQTYWFAIRGKDTIYYPVTKPASSTITPSLSEFVPMLSEGMEIKLYPGEALYAYRLDHAVGSSIILYCRYIETDLPLYDYVEPQEKLRISKFRRATLNEMASRMGGGSGARAYGGSPLAGSSRGPGIGSGGRGLPT